MHRLLRMLREIGATKPEAPTTPCSLRDRIIAEYRRYLLQERGLSQATAIREPLLVRAFPDRPAELRHAARPGRHGLCSTSRPQALSRTRPVARDLAALLLALPTAPREDRARLGVRRSFYILSRQIGLRDTSASRGPRLHDFRQAVPFASACSLRARSARCGIVRDGENRRRGLGERSASLLASFSLATDVSGGLLRKLSNSSPGRNRSALAFTDATLCGSTIAGDRDRRRQCLHPSDLPQGCPARDWSGESREIPRLRFWTWLPTGVCGQDPRLPTAG